MDILLAAISIDQRCQPRFFVIHPSITTKIEMILQELGIPDDDNVQPISAPCEVLDVEAYVKNLVELIHRGESSVYVLRLEDGVANSDVVESLQQVVYGLDDRWINVNWYGF